MLKNKMYQAFQKQQFLDPLLFLPFQIFFAPLLLFLPILPLRLSHVVIESCWWSKGLFCQPYTHSYQYHYPHSLMFSKKLQNNLPNYLIFLFIIKRDNARLNIRQVEVLKLKKAHSLNNSLMIK